MAGTNPAFSAGARYERSVWLRMARRAIKNTNAVASPTSSARLAQKFIDYGLTRQKRYDQKPGGLKSRRKGAR